MSKKIFITGSSDGLGLAAANYLTKQGHTVILHARNPLRAKQTLAACPGAAKVLTADLSTLSATKDLAAQVNAYVADALGGPDARLDAVIHNAGMGYQEAARGTTEDGLPAVLAVNSLAPYILTALIKRPHRLIYISSALHASGDPSLSDITWTRKHWQGTQAYSDTKLHNILLSNAAARHFKPHAITANAVTPGWVATKMGGARANDRLDLAHLTQCWLATSADAEGETGKYWYHGKEASAIGAAGDVALQERYLKMCAELSGVELEGGVA